MGIFGQKDDPDVDAARAEAEAALPVGWTLAEEDREAFHLVGADRDISLDVWAAAAEGPGEALELAIACDKAGAFRALAARLRGDLPTSDAWSPPPGFVERL